MYKNMLLVFLAMVPWVDGRLHSFVPSCALRCWENTLYISDCLDNFDCLCRESKYQNSVFQCLYSQCHTAHYGPALHYTISQCSGANGDQEIVALPVPKHDALRRQELEYIEGGSVAGSGSVYGSPTQSNVYSTESVGFRPQSVQTPSMETATSLNNPSHSLETLTTTAPATTSATPTFLEYSGSNSPLLSTSSPTSVPVLFEGLAPEEGASVLTPVIITLVVLYFTF